MEWLLPEAGTKKESAKWYKVSVTQLYNINEFSSSTIHIVLIANNTVLFTYNWLRG